jgi:ABC-type nickel/cobalt efflux system permease component RcnA
VPETDPVRSDDRFTSLIASDDVTVPFMLGAMLISAGFGALHALGPGHGKTVVAAYLVGERGTARHAVLLGATVTGTHTVSVFALGLITLYASQLIVPERLYPWLTLVSGLMVVGLGGALLVSRVRGLQGRPGPRAGLRPGPTPAGSAAKREIVVEHGHSHEHDHSHAVPDPDGSPITWKGLLALGVSGGILPCPSALVVLLGAISLHRVGLGLLLVVAFSIGLAAVLTGIGLAMVWAGRAMSRSRWLGESGPLHRLAFAPLLIGALPSVSALAITAVGAVMTARAVMGETGGGFGLL